MEKGIIEKLKLIEKFGRIRLANADEELEYLCRYSTRKYIFIFVSDNIGVVPNIMQAADGYTNFVKTVYNILKNEK